MFCCTDREMVLGEVVGIELSNAAFQFEDAGVTCANDSVFVSDSSFKVGNA